MATKTGDPFLDEDLDTFETQAWICPYCFDDHKVNEPNKFFCKNDDLVDTIKKARNQIGKQQDEIDDLMRKLDRARGGF